MLLPCAVASWAAAVSNWSWGVTMPVAPSSVTTGTSRRPLSEPAVSLVSLTAMSTLSRSSVMMIGPSAPRPVLQARRDQLRRPALVEHHVGDQPDQP
ncbi:hypothetical protein [Streptomyces noursei]|uniref:hypothetical protein n=1 Tax=Streptomyces noursei TaxID=1971 RepID=UPI0022A79B8B|nr:hypothetical protein [Streptomyces noursei]MCZ1013559.1 hypothetical protein [Streptomyces noursei]